MKPIRIAITAASTYIGFIAVRGWIRGVVDLFKSRER